MEWNISLRSEYCIQWLDGWLGWPEIFSLSIMSSFVHLILVFGMVFVQLHLCTRVRTFPSKFCHHHHDNKQPAAAAATATATVKSKQIKWKGYKIKFRYFIKYMFIDVYFVCLHILMFDSAINWQAHTEEYWESFWIAHTHTHNKKKDF